VELYGNLVIKVVSLINHINGNINNKKDIMNTNNMTRTEAYNTIKSMGLQDACFKKFGKNFTMCKTADLIALIEAHKDSEEKVPVIQPAPIAATQHESYVDVAARAAITRMTEILVKNGQFNEYESEEVLSTLGGALNVTLVEDKSESPYSDNEIDTMFDDMGI
jgi:hypothetical protein